MRRVSWLFVAALAVGGGTAQAAVVLALDLRSLTSSATVIADLEVVGQESRRLPSGQIVTEHVALVREGLRGAADGEEIVFFTEGGIVDGIGVRVAGEPQPRVGERILAFLQSAGAGLRFVGMTQGCLRIVDDQAGTRVLPPSAHAVLVARTPAGMVRAAPAVATPRALAPFLRELRALVAR
jgi:hypothetical protein